MKTSVIRGMVCILTASGLSACAADGEPAPAQSKESAETFFPQAPRNAQLVDWTTAGQQRDVENPASNFRRAQYLMAKLANAAYNGDEEFSQTAESSGFILTDSVHTETGAFGQIDADAVAGVSTDYKMSFVAIRGSHELSDYAIDALIVPVTSYDNGGQGVTLHAGIAAYAEAVYNGLRDALWLSCDAEVKAPLWITGHSLGGAAAAAVAYQLAREGCNVAGVSLYGPMRTGLANWQSAYNAASTPLGELSSITQRWVHKDDPMYCLPVGGAWRHVGLEARVDKGVDISSDASISKCDSAEGWIGGLKATLAATDLPTNIAVGVHRALTDWLSGLIELSLFCTDDTRWDDLFSLGACTVVSSGNDFVQTYSITPSEFLGQVVSLVAAADHEPERYARSLSADFTQAPDTRPVVNLHLQLGISLNDFYAGTWLWESNSGVWCTPELGADGQPFCDIPVRVGSQVRLETGGYDRNYGYLAGDCPHPLYNTGVANDSVCEFVAQDGLNIPFKWVAALF